MAKWQHPELGTFAFDDIEWVGECNVPAFKVFTFREGRRNAGRSRLKLRFETENETEEETPSKKSVNLALKLIRNQEQLAARVTKAVWNDLQGKEPNSGMWWHGDLTSVAENVARAHGGKSKPLAKAEDLHALLGASSIVIRDRIYLYERPSATILFQAAFELEHGLGVLTDGSRVIGTGYEMDISPFFKYQVRK